MNLAEKLNIKLSAFSTDATVFLKNGNTVKGGLARSPNGWVEVSEGKHIVFIREEDIDSVQLRLIAVKQENFAYPEDAILNKDNPHNIKDFNVQGDEILMSHEYPEDLLAMANSQPKKKKQSTKKKVMRNDR